MYKQDFTNVLDLEINRLEKLKGAILNEIKVRKESNDEISDKIQRAVNEKVILQLEAELAAKDEFMDKLKKKNIEDKAELDAEFSEVVLENYKDLFAQSESLPLDVHDKNYVDLYMKEFNLWFKETHKEACVYYFNCLKRIVDSHNDKK